MIVIPWIYLLFSGGMLLNIEVILRKKTTVTIHFGLFRRLHGFFYLLSSQYSWLFVDNFIRFQKFQKQICLEARDAFPR